MATLEERMEEGREFIRHNRIINLYESYKKCENEVWKKMLRQHIENLLDEQKDKEFIAKYIKF